MIKALGYVPRFKEYSRNAIPLNIDSLESYRSWLVRRIYQWDPCENEDSSEFGPVYDLDEMHSELRDVDRAIQEILTAATCDASSEIIPFGIEVCLDDWSHPMSETYDIVGMDKNGSVLIRFGNGDMVIVTIGVIIFEQFHEWDDQTPVEVEGLPEPIRSWFYYDQSRYENVGGHIYSPEDKCYPQWSEIVDRYSREVWGTRMLR
ncbi:MAG: hypothetical protein WCR80_05895 [Bacilli bacterium]